MVSLLILLLLLPVLSSCALYSGAEARQRRELTLLDRAPVFWLLDRVAWHVGNLTGNALLDACADVPIPYTSEGRGLWPGQYAVYPTEYKQLLDERERYAPLIKDVLLGLGYTVDHWEPTGREWPCGKACTTEYCTLAYQVCHVTAHIRVCW